MDQQLRAHENTSGRPAGPPILVVEDDPLTRQLVRWTLEDMGLRVETAADGREAIRRASQMRPSLVVLDMRLPGPDGAEVAAAIRGRLHDTVPILLMSAIGSTADNARRVGAYDYLTKPFDLSALVAAARRGLRPN